MNRKHALIAFLFSVFALSAQAQIESQTKVVFPEKFTFINNIKYNNNLYLGKVNLSIPLYTVTDKDIDLPFSLTYSSQGVRPQQHAGPNGLDWSMTQYEITRKVNGKPDERNDLVNIHTVNGSFTEELPHSYLLNVEANQGTGWDHPASIVNKALATTVSLASYPLILNSNARDFEPDEFYFNTGKYSGSFLLGLDAAGKLKTYVKGQPDVVVSFKLAARTFWSSIILQATNQLQIRDKWTTLISGFTVQTPDGLIFEYGGVDPNDNTKIIGETQHDFFGLYNDDQYVSSWKLVKVFSPQTNASVSLSYERGEPAAVFNEGHSLLFYNQKYYGDFYDLYTTLVQTGGRSLNGTMTRPLHLKEVSASNVTMTFQTSINNNELKYDTRLVALNILDKGRYYQNQQVPEPGFLTAISPQGPYHNNPFNNNSIGFYSPYLSRGDINMMRTGYPMYTRPYFEYLAVTQLNSPLFLSFGNLTPFVGNMGLGSNYYNIGHSFSYAPLDQGAVETVDLGLLKTRKLDGITVKNKNGTVVNSFTFGYNNNPGGRLQLTSLKSLNESNPYIFNYTPITSLPADYLTRKIDHWGFYNASNSDFEIFDQASWGSYHSFRNPTTNLTTLSQGMLEQVQFPTGGVQKFVYELNSYKKTVNRSQLTGDFSVTSLSTATIGGGVRIREIQHYKSLPVSSANLDRSELFEYGDGLLNGEPQYHWQNFKGELGTGSIINLNRFSTYNLNPASINGEGAPVSYKEVTVRETGLGKTKYEFSNFETNPDIPGVDFSIDKIVAFPSTSKDFERGKLLKKEVYVEDLPSTPIFVEENLYQANPGTANRFIPAVLAQSYKIYPANSPISQNPNYVEGTAYKHLLYPYQLKSKKTKTLDRSSLQWIETTEDYTYSNGSKWLSEATITGIKGTTLIDINDNQLKKVTIKGSDNSIKNIITKHPLDYRSSIFSSGQSITGPESKGLETLIDNFKIATVVSEQTSTVKQGSSVEKYTSGLLHTFTRGTDIRLYGGVNYYAANFQKLYKHVSGSNSPFNHNFSPSAFVPSADFLAVYEALSHDKYAHVNEQKSLGTGASVIYIWGYKGQYPIMKITGSNLSTVKSILGASTLEDMDKAIVEEATIKNAATVLRNHADMKHALVESYTYKPLVGMKSKTDPRGSLEHYEYDEFNRLNAVKNHQADIFKTYEYHYRVYTQNTTAPLGTSVINLAYFSSFGSSGQTICASTNRTPYYIANATNIVDIPIIIGTVIYKMDGTYASPGYYSRGLGIARVDTNGVVAEILDCNTTSVWVDF